MNFGEIEVSEKKKKREREEGKIHGRERKEKPYETIVTTLLAFSTNLRPPAR